MTLSKVFYWPIQPFANADCATRRLSNKNAFAAIYTVCECVCVFTHIYMYMCVCVYIPGNY